METLDQRYWALSFNQIKCKQILRFHYITSRFPLLPHPTTNAKFMPFYITSFSLLRYKLSESYMKYLYFILILYIHI